MNIGKIIIEANSREFWVVAKFMTQNLWKMVANIRKNITTSKNVVWAINENVINKGGWSRLSELV